MLDFIQPTKFKIIAAIIIASVILMCEWSRDRIMMYYVTTSDLTLRKAEFERVFREFSALMAGDNGLIQLITLQSTATNIALIVALSYLASCVITKLHVR